MGESNKEKKRNKNFSKVKTFSVPFTVGEIRENITIDTNSPTKPSKEEIITQAFNFHTQGNIIEAAKYYQYFINQGYKDQRVFSNYGIILRDLGNLKDAELFTRKAIELKPNLAETHSNLGTILNLLGNLKEAELSTRKAIKLNPNFAQAHSNLGNILRDLGNLKDAELSTRKAIKLNPDFADAYLNLGSILKDLGKLEKAAISTRKAIEINPNFAQAHSNLGAIMCDLGHLKEAELSTRKAIELNPDDADAHFNLATLELLKGNYESGLEYYEFRRFKGNKANLSQSNKSSKRIESEQLEKGKKLLVVSEQGLGDTLQYMRYIPYLLKEGFDIDFCAQEKLHSLIKASGIDKNPLTPEQVREISKGQWIPLLSLARYLKVRPENPIVSKPYIHSTEHLIKKWQKILSKEKRPIIGINWQGNPELENSYQGRSIPLEKFSILPDQNDITLLSLQKGFGSDQLENCSFKNKFVNCQSQIDSTWDFLENAAIIENCDLIISCDTSIAHLAGGMGKKVWLLLRDIPFWTWGLGEERTFWYESMRLFRQKERHNWNEVMIRVSNQLRVKF